MNKETAEWINESAESWEPTANTETTVITPPFCKAITDEAGLPTLPHEQIEGVLRRGGMLLLQGASKMYKSFALIGLSVAIATGGKWLDFSCRQGKVLYINLEIRKEQFLRRVYNVAEAMGADKNAVRENLTIWNARGENLDIGSIKEKFAEWEISGQFDAIVIDPLYKVQAGNENDAEAINRFFNIIDAIAQENNTSVIICHHHSKGGQLKKSAIDRSSGSGVFGRAADAIIDFTAYPTSGVDYEAKKEIHSLDDATSLWVSFIVRDFKAPEDFGAWFTYPVHSRDTTGLLDLRRVNKETYKDKVQERFDETFDALIGDGEYINRKEAEKALGCDRKTVDKYVQSSLLFEGETLNNNRAIIRRLEEE